MARPLKPEQKLNRDVMKALAAADAVRVENSVGPGTPDINCVHAWIENKYLPGWPGKADTVVKVPKYVPRQRAWHVKRVNAGGKVFVCIRVGAETFLFDGRIAAEHLGLAWRRQDFYDCAVWCSGEWDTRTAQNFAWVVQHATQWFAGTRTE